MDTFVENSKLISINKSSEANKSIVSSLVPLHALSGCDSVPMMFGIGKSKALKSQMPLHHVGNKKSVLKDVLKEGFEFVASCYGIKEIDF